MIEVIFGSVFWFIVATALLVAFHEFGHFWVARRCGVKVLRFSVGFGRPLWMRRGQDGTEYVVAAIPLGGYVKMLDEREGDVPRDELAQSFNRQSLGKRSAIVAAGPLFNLAFALVAFWAMFLIGVPDYQPVIGQAKGLAESAGLRSGDRISEIDGAPVDNWTHVVIGLTTRAYSGESVPLRVVDEAGQERLLRLDLASLEDQVQETKILEQMGIEPWHWTRPALVGGTVPDSAAAKAGMREGDLVRRVGAVEVASFVAMAEEIQKQAPASDGRVTLVVRRGDAEISLPMRAVSSVEDGTTVWRIGMFAELHTTVRRAGPLAAIPESFKEAWRITAGSVAMIYHLIAGDASLRNVSGPISIARFADASARAGVDRFLWFLGVISLSLFIINLLPIPILDGGHLLYYFIEWVKGSPLSESAQVAGQYVGMAALLALMSLAFFNDIVGLMAPH